jgi:hypothetical protein
VLGVDDDKTSKMDIYADPRDEDGKTFCETNLVIFSAYSY